MREVPQVRKQTWASKLWILVIPTIFILLGDSEQVTSPSQVQIALS